MPALNINHPAKAAEPDGMRCMVLLAATCRWVARTDGCLTVHSGRVLATRAGRTDAQILGAGQSLRMRCSDSVAAEEGALENAAWLAWEPALSKAPLPFAAHLADIPGQVAARGARLLASTLLWVASVLEYFAATVRTTARTDRDPIRGFRQWPGGFLQRADARIQSTPSIQDGLA